MDRARIEEKANLYISECGLTGACDLVIFAEHIAQLARAEALDECAELCETSSIPFDIEVWASNTKKGMTAKTALALAESIRALKEQK